jgi:hypothetical protein
MKSLGVILSICFISVLCAATDIPAENAARNEALKYLSIRPDVKVFVHQTDHVVLTPLSIAVQITNLTDSNMSISGIKIDFPEMFLGREMENPVALDLSEAKDLDAGNAIIETVQFKPRASHWYSSLFNLRMMFFKPGDYEARVIVTYKLLDRNQTMIEEKVLVKLVPPVISILWGSIFGSVLLALYIGLYKRTKTAMTWKNTLLQFVSVAATGIVCGFIIVFLLFRFKDLDLPVTIAVTDFFGGLVLGLFTYKLGDWLYTKLAEINSPAPIPPASREVAAVEEKKAD